MPLSVPSSKLSLAKILFTPKINSVTNSLMKCPVKKENFIYLPINSGFSTNFLNLSSLCHYKKVWYSVMMLLYQQNQLLNKVKVNKKEDKRQFPGTLISGCPMNKNCFLWEKPVPSSFSVCDQQRIQQLWIVTVPKGKKSGIELRDLLFYLEHLTV